MKRYSVSFTNRAKNDLDDIGDYIAFELGEPEVAIKILDSLYKKCDKLKVFPKGLLVREYIDSVEFRFAHCGNYIIAYSVNEKKLEVTIRNIIYSKRDIGSIL